MTKVVVQDGNVDKALSRFKAKVAKSGIPSEVKKRKCYTKPGVQKREAKKVNTRNARRNAKRNSR